MGLRSWHKEQAAQWAQVGDPAWRAPPKPGAPSCVLPQLAVCSKSPQAARSLGAEMVSVHKGYLEHLGTCPLAHAVSLHCHLLACAGLGVPSRAGGTQSQSKDWSLSRTGPCPVILGKEAVLCVVGLEQCWGTAMPV